MAMKMVTGSAAPSVGKEFIKSFTSVDTTETDLTKAEELARGLTFDNYHENISCKILTGINVNDFETVVGRIASRNQIPSETQQAIVDGRYGETNREFIREFVFNKDPSTGTMVYGRTITIKRENSTIDLAYSLFELEFTLSQKRIEEERAKRFLCFKIGSETVVRFEHPNFSKKEQDHVFDFCRARALKGFRQEYPALEAGSN